MQFQFSSLLGAKINRPLEVTRLLFKAAGIPVEFTKDGWRQLLQLHSSSVSAFIQAINIKADLGLYIAAYEERGIPLDTECQEVCYQPGVFLILRKEHGVWYVTDVISAGDATGFAPVFFWKSIRLGLSFVAAHVLCGWRRLNVQKHSESILMGGTFYD